MDNKKENQAFLTGLVFGFLITLGLLHLTGNTARSIYEEAAKNNAGYYSSKVNPKGYAEVTWHWGPMPNPEIRNVEK